MAAQKTTATLSACLDTCLSIYRQKSDFDLVGWPGKALTLFLISLFVCSGVASAQDYLAWNLARWQALNDLTLVQKNFSEISRRRPRVKWLAIGRQKYKQTPSKSYWWAGEDDNVNTSGPLQGYEEIARYPFKGWLLVEEKPILTLKKSENK